MFLTFVYLVKSQGAMEYLLTNPHATVNKGEFNDAAGIGVVVTPEQVEKAVMYFWSRFMF